MKVHRHKTSAGSLVAVLLLGACLAGCTDDSDEDDLAGGPTSASTPASSPAPTVTAAPPSSSPAGVADDPLQGTKEAVESIPGSDESSEEGLASGLRVGRPASLDAIADFLTFVIVDVDTYWTSVFQDSGLPEPQVTYAWPEGGVSLPTSCEPGFTDDDAAFYCTSNDTIVISQELARRVWLGQIRVNDDPDDGKESGDFSVAYVVAHEYAHSLQAELGILGRSVAIPVIRTELHADCWAGVWAHSAFDEGQLDPGDFEEAVETATRLGDYEVANPTSHGSPERRVRAFTTGFTEGTPDACEPFLLGNG